MDVNTIGEFFSVAANIMAAASVIVGGIAMITKITANKTDDEVVGTVQRGLKTIQKVIGLIAFDSASVTAQNTSVNKNRVVPARPAS